MTLNSAIAGLGLLDVATFVTLNVIVTDMAVRRLYSSAPNIWESIGKPVGPFWLPPRTTVQDTLTIYERRISLPELYKRVSISPGGIEIVGIIRGYYRFHKIALVMIVLGLLCFSAVFAWSFYK